VNKPNFPVFSPVTAMPYGVGRRSCRLAFGCSGGTFLKNSLVRLPYDLVRGWAYDLCLGMRRRHYAFAMKLDFTTLYVVILLNSVGFAVIWAMVSLSYRTVV